MKDIYVLYCMHELDKQNIIDRSVAVFDGALMVFSQWQESSIPYTLRCPDASLWVRVCGLPFQYLNMHVGSIVGRMFGETVIVEHFEHAPQNDYLRIRVGVQLQNPLIPGFFLVLDNGSHLWVQFKYEKIAKFCVKCGRVGHKTNGCMETREGIEASIDLAMKNLCRKGFVVFRTPSIFTMFNLDLRALPTKYSSFTVKVRLGNGNNRNINMDEHWSTGVVYGQWSASSGRLYPGMSFKPGCQPFTGLVVHGYPMKPSTRKRKASKGLNQNFFTPEIRDHEDLSKLFRYKTRKRACRREAYDEYSTVEGKTRVCRGVEVKIQPDAADFVLNKLDCEDNQPTDERIISIASRLKGNGARARVQNIGDTQVPSDGIGDENVTQAIEDMSSREWDNLDDESYVSAMQSLDNSEDDDHDSSENGVDQTHHSENQKQDEVNLNVVLDTRISKVISERRDFRRRIMVMPRFKRKGVQRRRFQTQNKQGSGNLEPTDMLTRKRKVASDPEHEFEIVGSEAGRQSVCSEFRLSARKRYCQKSREWSSRVCVTEEPSSQMDKSSKGVFRVNFGDGNVLCYERMVDKDGSTRNSDSISFLVNLNVEQGLTMRGVVEDEHTSSPGTDVLGPKIGVAEVDLNQPPLEK